MGKKVIKYFFLAMLVLVLGALIVRMMMSSDKSTFDDFEITEDSRTAYAESGDLTVKTLSLKDKIGGAGYFCAYSLYYAEETGELQVTVRYNTSATSYTGVESDKDFEFLLLNKKNKEDLNSSLDNSADAENQNMFKRYDGVYYRADSVESKSKYGFYRFKKLIFKDVDVSESGFTSDEFAIVMVPSGLELPDADADAVTRLTVYESIFDFQTIHFADQPVEDHKLSKKDLTELKENE